jgi:transposase
MSAVLAPGSKMTRMACWAHARRKVYEHQESDPERGELRAKESRRILDRSGEYLEGPVAKSVLPASKLGGAFNYIRNHWEALNVFVNDGALPIDNNQVERLMKRIAVGRKNWLFIGSMRAGIRNASLMSLVASAQRQDLGVAMYLGSFITHMLRGTAKTEELLPDRWKEPLRWWRCAYHRLIASIPPGSGAPDGHSG